MISKLVHRVPIAALVFLLGNFYSNLMFSQTADEIKFKELSAEIELKNTELDSLRTLLNARVELINIQKLKDFDDNEELKKLLSGSAILTNSISDAQIYLNNQKDELRVISAKLYDFYSNQIDSLNRIENKSTKENVLITSLIEKRLRVSPKIDILSFEPNKVFQLEKAKLGERVYLEFLNSASGEVEKKLKEIRILKKEIDNIILLNEETVSFLEEADFDNDISYFRSTTKSSVSYSETRDANPLGFENTIGTQAESFSNIISQLSLSKVDNNKVFSVENIAKNQDLNEFKTLIDNVERQLTDYKKVIDHKIKAK